MVRLYFQRGRWRNAEVDRFLQTDPKGFDAGGPNLYRSVRNFATVATDHSGQTMVLQDDAAQQAWQAFLHNEGVRTQFVKLADSGRWYVHIPQAEYRNAQAVEDKYKALRFPQRPDYEWSKEFSAACRISSLDYGVEEGDSYRRLQSTRLTDQEKEEIRNARPYLEFRAKLVRAVEERQLVLTYHRLAEAAGRQGKDFRTFCNKLAAGQTAANRELLLDNFRLLQTSHAAAGQRERLRQALEQARAAVQAGQPLESAFQSGVVRGMVGPMLELVPPQLAVTLPVHNEADRAAVQKGCKGCASVPADRQARSR